MLSAADFGAVGDGTTDDTAALQAALNTITGASGSFLVIPPGNYKVTSTLTVTYNGSNNNITNTGILAHGANFQSTINNGTPVLLVQATGGPNMNVTSFLIEGLTVFGSGQTQTKVNDGIVLQAPNASVGLYEFCIRDVHVWTCSGDGLRLAGNVFQ
jgi:hypothetical protein